MCRLVTQHRVRVYSLARSTPDTLNKANDCHRQSSTQTQEENENKKCDTKTNVEVRNQFSHKQSSDLIFWP